MIKPFILADESHKKSLVIEAQALSQPAPFKKRRDNYFWDISFLDLPGRRRPPFPPPSSLVRSVTVAHERRRPENSVRALTYLLREEFRTKHAAPVNRGSARSNARESTKMMKGEDISGGEVVEVIGHT